MRLDAIAIGLNPPLDINVIIEVPVGGEPIKYEMDKASGTLFVDRFLYTPMRYPGNYGFVLVFLPVLIVAIGLIALLLAQFLPGPSAPSYGIDLTTTGGIPVVAEAAAEPIVLLDR